MSFEAFPLMPIRRVAAPLAAAAAIAIEVAEARRPEVAATPASYAMMGTPCPCPPAPTT